MSNKAYYFGKNFNFAEVMNLMSYGTKHPETLTNIQKMTRLYRSTLRRTYQTELEGYRTDFGRFNASMTRVRAEFEVIKSEPLDSTRREQLVTKYEEWQADNFDPNMVIDESRPYCPAGARYFVWSDDALNRDPFGYYTPRLVSNKQPGHNLPFIEDYPMNDSHWNVCEQFPQDFDDTNYERQNVVAFNNK